MNSYRILNRWDQTSAFRILLGHPRVLGTTFSGGADTPSINIQGGPGGPSRRMDDQARITWKIEAGDVGGWAYGLKVRALPAPGAELITPTGWTDVVAATEGSVLVPLYPEYVIDVAQTLGTANRASTTLTFSGQPEHGEYIQLTDGISPQVYIVFIDPARGPFVDNFPWYGVEIGATLPDTITALRTKIGVSVTGLSAIGVLRFRATATNGVDTCVLSGLRGTEWNGIVIPNSSKGTITGGTSTGGTNVASFNTLTISY